MGSKTNPSKIGHSRNAKNGSNFICGRCPLDPRKVMRKQGMGAGYVVHRRQLYK